MKRIAVYGPNLHRNPWWENFITHIIETTETDLRPQERDRLLTESGARLISAKGSYLEFDDDEDAVIFILRWS